MIGVASPSGNLRSLRIAALVCLAGGSIGWVLIFLIFRFTPGQDWMVFDTAAKAWLHGDNALLMDGPRFTTMVNATHPWLRQKLVFHPWVYPPYTMLLALPFGLLPWWLNYTVFMAVSATGLVLALRLWAPPGAVRRLLLGGVLLCPATAFTIGAGQNSFMSAGLVTAGIWFMRRRPAWAGLCLGLLAFKPQLAILVPVALAAAGAWAAIAYAGATVAALLLASLVVPGQALWASWLHLFLSGDPEFHHWVEAGRLYGQSVFTCLRLAGAPEQLANVGQGVAILFAAVCVWRAYRSRLTEHHRFAVLLSAMTLGAAHLGDYDALLLGIAAILVLIDGLALPLTVDRSVLACAIWLSTGFEPPFVFPFAVVVPLLVAAFAIRVLRGVDAIEVSAPGAA